MGIKNAVLKTTSYAKRNGIKAAFFAAMERVSLGARNSYDYQALSAEELEHQREKYKEMAEKGNAVRIGIVVPLYNTPEKYLKEMVESVIAQTYGNWQLILADASEEPLSAALEYTKTDSRIRYHKLPSNEGISANTNKALEDAAGDYIGLLDHDDLLTPDALFEVAAVIEKSVKKNHLTSAAGCPVHLIYSDEDKFDDKKGVYYEPHIKPPFNMDLLLSNNYICHFTVIRSDIIKRLKERSSFDGAQDYDLFLRACAEAALDMPLAGNQIVHINKVLYHWRCHSASTAANPASKTYAYDAGKRAIESLLSEYGIRASVSELEHLGFYRVNYDPYVFSSRKDVGIVGGKILNNKKRICGGMYNKEGIAAFNGLPEGYSGGLQHRAHLQQDCYGVDLRCLHIREDLLSVYEKVTGFKYPGSTLRGDLPKEIAEMDEARIKELSLRLGDEMKKMGLRVMWDPGYVRRI